MKRFASLLILGSALALPGLAPGWAKVTGVPETVAVVAPPESKVTTGGGCTAINPCAVVTPALSDVTLPTPQSPPQPNPAASADQSANTGPAPAPRTAQADCPPAGGFDGARGQFAARGQGQRGGFSGRGRGEGGQFAGRGGFQRGQGAGQPGAGREGRGQFANRQDANGQAAGGQRGRGAQFARNFQGGRGREGCPPQAQGPQGAAGPAPTAR